MKVDVGDFVQLIHPCNYGEIVKVLSVMNYGCIEYENGITNMYIKIS